ncbi:MAG: 2-oxo acid dehydrogenase subunit E2, partial [Saccharofermentanales bacterium]
TITNMGRSGVESFTPVINPPETCIVGVSSTYEKVRSGKDGGLELYPAMTISLTIDHRALDGAPGGVFLQALIQTLENFDLFLMG